VKLLIGAGKKYLVEGEEFHTNIGVVDLSEGEEKVISHLGHEFAVLSPDIVDIYEKMPRAGSFMLKKDLGFFLAYLGVGCGDVVVDAGSGSGGLAIFLANIVGERGKVITYEKNPEFAKTAKKNIELSGLGDVAEVRIKDVSKGFDEDDGSVDALTLDLPESWKMINEASRILKRGGRIGLFNPYLEHAKEVNIGLRKAGFREIVTLESMVREMDFRKQVSRPRTSRVGHSGYLSFGRKVYRNK
jgi:tRNA (adenine57-N1/adenine58-N1)-methyltransferase